MVSEKWQAKGHSKVREPRVLGHSILGRMETGTQESNPGPVVLEPHHDEVGSGDRWSQLLKWAGCKGSTTAVPLQTWVSVGFPSRLAPTSVMQIISREASMPHSNQLLGKGKVLHIRTPTLPKPKPVLTSLQGSQRKAPCPLLPRVEQWKFSGPGHLSLASG